MGEPGLANGYGESGSDSDDTASPLKAAKRARERSGASAVARALIQQMKAQHKVRLMAFQPPTPSRRIHTSEVGCPDPET